MAVITLKATGASLTALALAILGGEAAHRETGREGAQSCPFAAYPQSAAGLERFVAPDIEDRRASAFLIII